ncbi:MAG: aminoglycoside phosphotransferase family protein [Candidatus Heimdallarchaeaceae archaeon]
MLLNAQQLTKFCKKMDINPEDIEPNFEGWRKLILYSKEKIFSFPRDPSLIDSLEMEAEALKFLSHYNHLPVPKYIDYLFDKDISYYRFLISSRLNGKKFSKFENKINLPALEKFLVNLSETFTLWHNIKVNEIPSTIQKDSEIINRKINTQTWGNFALDINQLTNAIYYIQGVIDFWGEKTNSTITTFLLNSQSFDKWVYCLKEIVELDHVLLHGDIHEDQILVESKETMKITGIIDWETIRIGNPIWEFNFLEWGLTIWNWRKNFSTLRRKMWKKYLNKRKIRLSTFEGLDLFYTLLEFLIVIEAKTDKHPITGLDTNKSITYLLKKLEKITKKIK